MQPPLTLIHLSRLLLNCAARGMARQTGSWDHVRIAAAAATGQRLLQEHRQLTRDQAQAWARLCNIAAAAQVPAEQALWLDLCDAAAAGLAATTVEKKFQCGRTALVKKHHERWQIPTALWTQIKQLRCAYKRERALEHEPARRLSRAMDNPRCLRVFTVFASDCKGRLGTGPVTLHQLATAAPRSDLAVVDLFMVACVASMVGLARGPDLHSLQRADVEWRTELAPSGEESRFFLVGWQRRKVRLLSSDPSPRRPALLPELPDDVSMLCPARWMQWWLDTLADKRPEAHVFSGRSQQQRRATLAWLGTEVLPGFTCRGDSVYGFKSIGVSSIKACDTSQDLSGLYAQAGW